MTVNLDQFVHALSDTVDLVGIDETMHGKRVGCMAWYCGRMMGADPSERKYLLYLGMLHDCGVSTTKEHRKLVDEMDWEDSNAHCRAGADRMAGFKPLSDFSEPILYHHTHWQSLKAMDIEEKVKKDANLIYLLDRVDALAQKMPGSNRLSKRTAIQKKIKDCEGTYFDPDLVALFFRAARSEAFWLNLDSMPLNHFIERRKKVTPPDFIPRKNIRGIAGLFAEIVDAKSPFTAEHSMGTSRLAGFLAEQSGLARKVCIDIEAAGLLHDIGKLKVPDDILEKQGRLNDGEMAVMYHHSYISYEILRQIEGLELIAIWAANHHETLDGRGYPFRRTAAELDTPSRMIAIADIFQALSQDRPYRKARKLEDIIAFLWKNARRGRLDSELVQFVADNRAACYKKALDG